MGILMSSSIQQYFQKLKNKDLKLFLLIFILCFGLSFTINLIKYNSEFKNLKKSYTLKNFYSDYTTTIKNPLFSKNIFRKTKFIAYGKHLKIISGEYKITFYLLGEKNTRYKIYFDILKNKNGKIVWKKSINQNFKQNNFIFTSTFKIYDNSIIEPRVRILNEKTHGFQVLSVKVIPLKKILPIKNLLFSSFTISFVFSLIAFSIFLLFSNSFSISTIFAFLSLYLITYYNILFSNWISEDAFITLRHVKNFLSGYGPVFNPGERVEGFTHALWFYILTGFKLTGLSYKGSAILPGLIFSAIFIYIALFKIKFRKKELSLSFGVPILLGTNAFIDFGTSGLETSLSYLLLGAYAYMISEKIYIRRPIVFGIVNGLLYLNRPDFGIFLIVSILFVHIREKNQESIKSVIKLISGFVISAGPYQIFRMGYYGALFPNPFYAKSGSSSYWSHGLLYLKDFLEGSLFGILLIIVSIFLYVSYKKNDSFYERFMISFSGFIHGFFVVRGGGDFMHGRFLLPSMILLALSINNINVVSKVKKFHHKLASIIAFYSLFLLALLKIPVQKKGITYNKGGISNERYFFYKNTKSSLKDIFTDNYIIMWKTIGKNYSNLSKKTHMHIKIAYKNVGFLGFYADKNVYIIDKLGLTDPVVARIKIKVRKRPGHEKYAPFGYLFHKRLTFGTTPFPLWNKIAKTKFGILWDLSPRTLKKFSFFLNKNFKENIDKSIKNFILKCDDNCITKNSDFLYFLKTFWLPYCNRELKRVFNTVYKKSLVEKNSTINNWLIKNKKNIKKINSTISGKITLKKFMKNIIFSIKHFGISVSEP